MGCQQNDVHYAIQRLEANKSPGVDDIYSNMLELIEDDHLNFLTTILNISYETGDIPQD